MKPVVLSLSRAAIANSNSAYQRGYLDALQTSSAAKCTMQTMVLFTAMSALAALACCSLSLSLSPFGFRAARNDDGEIQVNRGLPHDLLQPPSTTREPPCNNRVPVVAAHGMEVIDELDERLRHSCLVVTFDLHVGIPAWLRAIEW